MNTTILKFLEVFTNSSWESERLDPLSLVTSRAELCNEALSLSAHQARYPSGTKYHTRVHQKNLVG